MASNRVWISFTKMIPVEIIRIGANGKSIANLKQYRAGNLHHHLKPYVGGFPVAIDSLIRKLISGQVLHLYAGRSDIGTVRVDLECWENVRVLTWLRRTGAEMPLFPAGI